MIVQNIVDFGTPARWEIRGGVEVVPGFQRLIG